MCRNMPHEGVMTIDKANNGYMITHCGEKKKPSKETKVLDGSEECDHKMYVAKNLKEAMTIVKSCLEENDSGGYKSEESKPIMETESQY